jgi:hypothetical protein
LVAVDNQGRKVEIKTTTRSSISLSASGTEAERLIVVKLDALTGAAEIIHDGVAAQLWDLAGKPGKNGQKRIALSKLPS